MAENEEIKTISQMIKVVAGFKHVPIRMGAETLGERFSHNLSNFSFLVVHGRRTLERTGIDSVDLTEIHTGGRAYRLCLSKENRVLLWCGEELIQTKPLVDIVAV